MKSKSSYFVPIAMRAFPPDCETVVSEAALSLSPWVDPQYRRGSVAITVRGHAVDIPQRLHFLGKRNEDFHSTSVLASITQCLLTRSTDGYVRHAALRSIVSLNESWTIPFVVLLAGEYVVEIIDDLVNSLPALDAAAYGAFVRENIPLMSLLESRATSYWNCYYRHSFADRHQYPGIKFLNRLEQWACQETGSSPSRPPR
jgi:hypothetical protein